MKLKVTKTETITLQLQIKLYPIKKFNPKTDWSKVSNVIQVVEPMTRFNTFNNNTNQLYQFNIIYASCGGGGNNGICPSTKTGALNAATSRSLKYFPFIPLSI